MALDLTAIIVSRWPDVNIDCWIPLKISSAHVLRYSAAHYLTDIIFDRSGTLILRNYKYAAHGYS